MKEESIMQVDVDGDYITVTMTGTSFRSTYFEAPDSPGLMQSDPITVDAGTTSSRNQFLALAWIAAHKKARELGWLV